MKGQVKVAGWPELYGPDPFRRYLRDFARHWRPLRSRIRICRGQFDGDIDYEPRF